MVLIRFILSILSRVVKFPFRVVRFILGVPRSLFRHKKPEQKNKHIGVHSVVIDDIAKIMTELAKDRPIFHAEADFQHALAWQIKTIQPEAKIRLETRPLVTESMFLDLLVVLNGQRLGIECKYMVKEINASHDSEMFRLKNQSAHDIRRYDTLKDLCRLERFIHEGAIDVGLLIIVSNDNAYWKSPSGKATMDKDFRIHTGQEVSGKLQWASNTGAGTMRGREQPLTLADTYKLEWQPFSQPSRDIKKKFCYLAVPVGAR